MADKINKISYNEYIELTEDYLQGALEVEQIDEDTYNNFDYKRGYNVYCRRAEKDKIGAEDDLTTTSLVQTVAYGIVDDETDAEIINQGSGKYRSTNQFFQNAGTNFDDIQRGLFNAGIYDITYIPKVNTGIDIDEYFSGFDLDSEQLMASEHGFTGIYVYIKWAPPEKDDSLRHIEYMSIELTGVQNILVYRYSEHTNPKTYVYEPIIDVDDYKNRKREEEKENNRKNNINYIGTTTNSKGQRIYLWEQKNGRTIAKNEKGQFTSFK